MNDLILRGNVFNQTGYLANADIFGTDIQTRQGVSGFRVSIIIGTTAATFNVKITDGTTTHVADLRDGALIQPNRMYTFVFDATSDLQYNFRLTANNTIEYLKVVEILRGVV